MKVGTTTATATNHGLTAARLAATGASATLLTNDPFLARGRLRGTPGTAFPTAFSFAFCPTALRSGRLAPGPELLRGGVILQKLALAGVMADERFVDVDVWSERLADDQRLLVRVILIEF